MKTTSNITTIIGAAILWLASWLTAPAGVQAMTDIHIGLSPYYPAEETKVIRRRLGQFMLESTPGTTVTVADAYALTEIARFQIPKLNFDSPEERARQMSESFAKLAKWFDQSARGEPVALLKNSSALRIPEFLQAVSGQAPDQPSAVLLIGNPLAMSVEEPAFSMSGVRVPSDAHIRTNLAASIYGTSDKAGRLRNCVIRQCYLREGIWQTQLHKEIIQRFWALVISQQGGVLADFTGDINRVFASATQHGLVAVGTYSLDPDDGVLEMRLVEERKMPVRVSKPDVTVTNMAVVPRTATLPPSPKPVAHTNEIHMTNTPVPVVVVATVVAPEPVKPPAVGVVPLTNVVAPPKPSEVHTTAAPVMTNTPPIPVPPKGRMGIAVWWELDADVDLYVGVPGQRELFYRNTSHKFGQYFRDIRRANQPGTDQQWRQRWENVELPEQVPFDSVTAWLNLYKGCGQPVSGKVRVQFADGRVFEAPFIISATKGNLGADRSTRQTSPYWTQIHLQDMIQR